MRMEEKISWDKTSKKGVFWGKNIPSLPLKGGRDGVWSRENKGGESHAPKVFLCAFGTVLEVLLESFGRDSLKLSTVGGKAVQNKFPVWKVLAQNHSPAIAGQISGIGQNLLPVGLHFLCRRISVKGNTFAQLIAVRIHDTERDKTVCMQSFDVFDH